MYYGSMYQKAMMRLFVCRRLSREAPKASIWDVYEEVCVALLTPPVASRLRMLRVACLESTVCCPPPRPSFLGHPFHPLASRTLLCPAQRTHEFLVILTIDAIDDACPPSPIPIDEWHER